MSGLIEQIEDYCQDIIKLEEQNEEKLLTLDSEDKLKKIMEIMLVLEVDELDILHDEIFYKCRSKSYKPYSHFKKLNNSIKNLQYLKKNHIELKYSHIFHTEDRELSENENVYNFYKSINEFCKIRKAKDDHHLNIENDAVSLTESTIELETLSPLPEEITQENTISLIEGAKKQILINAYERSSQAKKECIEQYGYKCTICNFDFEKMYGEIGKGFIHIHHLKPLSEIDEEYEVNPIHDLRPVCPNCHAMLHRRNPAYSIEEIENIINKKIFTKKRI